MNEQGELPGFEKLKKGSKKTQETSFEDTQKRIISELGIQLQKEPHYPQNNAFSITDPRTEKLVRGKVTQDQNGNLILCYEDGTIISNLATIADIYKQLHPNQSELPFIRMKIVDEIARWRNFNTPEEIIEVKRNHGIPLSKNEISYNRKRLRGREATLINVGVRKARGRKG